MCYLKEAKKNLTGFSVSESKELTRLYICPSVLRCCWVLFHLSILVLAQGQQDSHNRLPQKSIQRVPSRIPIFYFDKERHFCASRLDLETPFFVSRLQVAYSGSITVSPDERYLMYHETLADHSRQVLVLYDVRKGTERILRVSPPYNLEEAEFSPDSRTVALLVAGDRNLVPSEQEGIYLYDTAGSCHRFIPYSRETKLPQSEVTGKKLKWSKDGRQLYLAFNTPRNKRGTIDREYFKLDPASGRYQHVTGSYGGLLSTYSFFDKGTTVALHDNSAGGKGFYTDLISHNRKYRATVDKKLRLQISGPGINTEIIAHAEWHNDDGDVCPLKITAWLENRYLIYSVHFTDHIYDLQTKNNYPIFREEVKDFTWLDGHKEGGIEPKTSDAHPPFISLVPPPR